MKDFVELTKSEIRHLFRYIHGRVASFEDSEDIMQETFLAFYARWNLGEPIRDALAWLVRTAHHKIVDRCRRKSRTSAPPDRDRLPRDSDASDLWEIADADAFTPEEEAQRRELRDALMNAIEALPAEQREVFLMTEVEGLTFREIQARTGVPLNTLLSRKRYAVLKLRTKLSFVRGSRN
jgi:RNA polymerase sigma factor (sigma-70 family)